MYILHIEISHTDNISILKLVRYHELTHKSIKTLKHNNNYNYLILNIYSKCHRYFDILITLIYHQHSIIKNETLHFSL